VIVSAETPHPTAYTITSANNASFVFHKDSPTGAAMLGVIGQISRLPVQEAAGFYDESYKQENYFRHRSWIYEPYISCLLSFCKLRKGASVLDVGCGQGFFSYQLHMKGMQVHGVDLSEMGVRMAQSQYRRLGITFSVGDIQLLTFRQQFDCIFVRSCSLYNTDSFSLQNDATRNLLRHLKANGTFIFVYNSNFSSKESPTWRLHSLADVKQHFKDYPGANFFFLNRITTLLLRGYSFTSLATGLNIILSKASSMGGDLVCIFRKLPTLGQYGENG
jgi:SAM-dependent methyltransferase